MKNYVSAILLTLCFQLQSMDKIFYDQKSPYYEANMLFDKSEYAQAVAKYEELFESRLDVTKDQETNAHLCYGQALWALGNLGKGYEEVNTYLGKTGGRPALVSPLKPGASVDRKRILVRATDGLGDTFSFAAYCAQLKRMVGRNGKVILKCQNPISDVMARSSACFDEVVKNGEADPEFDHDCYLIGVPAFLHIRGLEDATVTMGQYIHPYQDKEIDMTRKWLDNLGDTERPLAICWKASSNPVPGGRVLKRNIPLSILARLGEMKGTLLYSLMSAKIMLRQDFDRLPANEQEEAKYDWITGSQAPFIRVFDKDFDKRPFEDTIGLMCALREKGGHVVSVDTSVPNLAGACNVPTILLQDYDADSRWGIPGYMRARNRLFPSVMEFRQPRRIRVQDIAREKGVDLTTASSDTVRMLKEKALERAWAPVIEDVTAYLR